MIEANELRIGNWVTMEGADQPFQITVGSFKRNLWDYDPIPITTELLEAAGFETVDNDRDEEMILWLYDHPTEKHNYNEYLYLFEEDIWHRIGEGVNLYSHIQCVHQLQNLYFSLTGKELEIKNLRTKNYSIPKFANGRDLLKGELLVGERGPNALH